MFSFLRRAALYLCLLVLVCGSAAGEPGIQSLDFSDRDYLLPIDDSAGLPPQPTGYISANEYRDSTISVKVGSGRWHDECDYWFADIVIQDASQLRTAVCGGQVIGNVSKEGVRMCENVKAVVGLNGDYSGADEKDGYGYTVRMGVLYQNNLQDREGRWNNKLMDILAVDEDGDFHIIHRPTTGQMSMTIDGKRILNTWVFGPGLVENGEVIRDYRLSDKWLPMASEERKQRMALCQVGPLTYKIVCCGGPYAPNSGMTLQEFAGLLADLEVETAYNLDGGDSSMLYFRGEKINFKDNTSHRTLRDIIYFASAEGTKNNAEK